MQERQITIDGTKHEIARPFVVLATQNPAEYEGTYPLPEAELDRFMVRVVARLPVRRRRGRDARRARRPRSGRRPPARRRRRDGARGAGGAGGIEGTEALRQYVVAICEATREDERVELGASPGPG